MTDPQYHDSHPQDAQASAQQSQRPAPAQTTPDAASGQNPLAHRPWLKNYSPGVAVDVHLPETSLSHLIDDAVRDVPHKVALEFFGATTTYAELGSQIDRAAEGLRLAELPERLHEFDAVVSCTASQLPIIGLGAVERALKKRRHRPLFMVDLAVPRDIEPEVRQLDDVYLYTVDDLAQVVQTAHASRQAAVAQAEAIIDAGVRSFVHWLDQRSPTSGVVPLIQKINAQADAWRAAELARARKRLAKGEDIDAVLEALSRGLTQKMLHGALAELHSADGEHRDQTSHTLSRIFLRSRQA